jgi:uncharacterized protein YhbP (UPF0306 family)
MSRSNEMQSAQPVESVLLREYVNTGKFMQVTTQDREGKPWPVFVWYASNPQLELVFTSNVARLHSDYLKTRPAVAGGIFTTDLEEPGYVLEGPGTVVRGVTFTGDARECAGHELEEAYETYATRWQQTHELFPLARIKSGESPMRMYKITPVQFILFDEKNYRDQPKRVILEW